MKLTELILDFIYPPRCCICGKLTGMFAKSGICESCAKNAWYEEEECDYSCTIRNKFKSKVYFDFGMAVFKYPFVKNSIERFKYYGEKNIGRQYAEIMYSYFNKRGLLNNVDMLVSVPLSGKKLKERGYNQAEFIAESLAAVSGIEHIKGALLRVKDTERQSALKPEERYLNVKGVFKVVKSGIEGKNVVIVDDIFTTGATINECARVLKKAGAAKVGFLTIASAGNSIGSDKNV